jgi:hypothetical protein
MLRKGTAMKGKDMMTRSQKVVGFLTSGSFLWLGLMLATVSSAASYFINDSSVRMVSDSSGQFKPGTTIKGDIVRVDGDNYFVRQGDGTVVRMHVDKTTMTKSNLPAKPGDSVEAKVDAKGHAISFLTDRPVSH